MLDYVVREEAKREVGLDLGAKISILGYVDDMNFLGSSKDEVLRNDNTLIGEGKQVKREKLSVEKTENIVVAREGIMLMILRWYYKIGSGLYLVAWGGGHWISK